MTISTYWLMENFSFQVLLSYCSLYPKQKGNHLKKWRRFFWRNLQEYKKVLGNDTKYLKKKLIEIIYVPKYIYLIETYKIKDWTSIFLDGVYMIISDHKQIIVENTFEFLSQTKKYQGAWLKFNIDWAGWLARQKQ